MLNTIDPCPPTGIRGVTVDVARVSIQTITPPGNGACNVIQNWLVTTVSSAVHVRSQVCQAKANRRPRWITAVSTAAVGGVKSSSLFVLRGVERFLGRKERLGFAEDEVERKGSE